MEYPEFEGNAEDWILLFLPLLIEEMERIDAALIYLEERIRSLENA